MFIKIPTYDNGIDNQIDFNKISDFYCNKTLIIGIEEQYNDITKSYEAYFWTVDGSEFYTPLSIDDLMLLINS